MLGAEHTSTLNSVINLAGLLISQGAYGEAEPLFRRALQARERVLGPEHPDTVMASTLLAKVLTKLEIEAESAVPSEGLYEDNHGAENAGMSITIRREVSDNGQGAVSSSIDKLGDLKVRGESEASWDLTQELQRAVGENEADTWSPSNDRLALEVQAPPDLQEAKSASARKLLPNKVPRWLKVWWGR